MGTSQRYNLVVCLEESNMFRVAVFGLLTLLSGCASVDLPHTEHRFNGRASYSYDFSDSQLFVTVVCRYPEPITNMYLSGHLSSSDRCARYTREIAEKIVSAGSFKLAAKYVPYYENWKSGQGYRGFNTRENGETVTVIVLTLPLKD
jgi:hypothetical protein